MDKSAKKYASAEQKLRLIHLVEADPQLKSGKFSSTLTKAISQKRWQAISEELNSITGAKKTWEEWRKTWQDRKANAKKKFSLLLRQANLTGGGPPLNPPTLEESLIINCFDEQSLVGHTDSQESIATCIDLTHPVEKNAPKLGLSQPNKDVIIIKSENEETGIDLSQPNIPIIQVENEVTGRDLSQPHHHSENKPAGRDLQILPKPKVITGKRRTVAQRRLQEGLNATVILNKAMQEKNEIKKKIYEQFMEQMTKQTNALVDIAAALNSSNK